MGGGDVGAAFAAALSQTGMSLTSKDLVERYPSCPSSPSDSKPIVLEQCKFFDLFDADPVEAREEMRKKRQEALETHGESYMRSIMRSTRHHPLRKNRQYDFRLTREEKTKLAANGLVASQRMQAESFGDIYYRLYTDDLPVFVTADSILHAWHRSFDAFLIEIETSFLSRLRFLLEDVLTQCQHIAVDDSEGHNLVAEAADDIEDYLKIAQSLITGHLVQSNETLETIWSAIQAERTAMIEVFSTPRGEGDNVYQLLCAVVLVHCLEESDALGGIIDIDSVISSLVADGNMGADSLSVGELVKLVIPTNVAKLIMHKETGAEERQNLLLSLQQEIVQKGLGAQLIPGRPLVEDAASAAAKPSGLPSSFALLGQRFVWSSFVFTRLVYDQVIQDEVKQVRRIPSAVDVAFALFGNNEAAQELARRMEATTHGDYGSSVEFVSHRDGIPFASNLITLRQVIDNEFNDSEEDVKSSSGATESASISTLWLRALRALSRPSPNTASTFHSGTWRRRQMNTQIASFTQLRHDTVVYAKQGSTRRTMCEYPDGMVDPYPVFWQRMKELAERAKAIAETTHLQHGRMLFEKFASTMGILEDISVCQATHKKLNDENLEFMKSVMEEKRGSGGSQYNGWYPKLFYESRQDSGKRDVLVVDVHTDSPSVEHGDPGCVLHLGVGDPVVAFFVVNNVVYAGPVSSSYEFMEPTDVRLTDEEFQSKLPSMRPPQWAEQSYLSVEREVAGKRSSRNPPSWEREASPNQ
ncbi:hypothetical protein PF008_g23720 [Phytophthora fragariae]|uniref:Uncharacterized protein n=1 Tax=Phytophthora fragariae TaxID=53985 RepID=A0A6G0QPZ3_9STRA|nr:hypothetical protein PF008_g23720 [Phytophthora fragariae]